MRGYIVVDTTTLINFAEQGGLAGLDMLIAGGRKLERVTHTFRQALDAFTPEPTHTRVAFHDG